VIVADICEGIGDCLFACPTESIRWVDGQVNAKGTRFARIDDRTCRDCGMCLKDCPIEGAVLDGR
jgi:NAD-dependent dihydropyrimidine dehydrogenase PreA subunit